MSKPVVSHGLCSIETLNIVNSNPSDSTFMLRVEQVWLYLVHQVCWEGGQFINWELFIKNCQQDIIFCDNLSNNLKINT